MRRKRTASFDGELISVKVSNRRALLDCMPTDTGQQVAQPASLYVCFQNNEQAAAFAERVRRSRPDGGYPMRVTVVEGRTGKKVTLASGATVLVLQAAAAA